MVAFIVQDQVPTLNNETNIELVPQTRRLF